MKMLMAIYKAGIQNRCIFIKLEPNVKKSEFNHLQYTDYKLNPSPHPLFTKYTFQLDLTKSEDELLKNMHHKTRYNIGLAGRKGLRLTGGDDIGEFWKLLKKTAKKDKFFQKASKWSISTEKVNDLWKKYVQENFSYIKEEFYKKAHLRNLSEERIEELWKKYWGSLQ